MKVLVTGATGFVGRNLIPILLDQGHAVTAVARHKPPAGALPWLERVAFVEHDLHQPLASPYRALGSPDVAVHLAWPGLPDYEASFHLEDNLPADHRFLEALVTGGLRQLLVTGTCLEYGMQSGALAETAPTVPVTAYGRAKDRLRGLLESLNAKHPFVLQWARLFYMHGPGQNPKSLLSQLDLAIAAGAPRFAMSGGEQLRDYLPVEVVCQRLAWLVAHPALHGAINVCSGSPISVRRLVESWLHERGVTMQLDTGRYPYPAYEPMEFWGTGRLQDGGLEKHGT
jgi:nucleoside-diphosphate-sugar epimerase